MKKLLIGLFALSLAINSYGQNLDLDKQMGKANAEMVASQMGIYENEQMTAYVRSVGERLVAQLDKPLFEYQFHLVEEPSPNAFALPGGYLYVTTGLLPILQSEDELACILGHEIIHSNNRHSIKQLRKKILPKMLEIPGNLIGMFDEDLGAVFTKPIETSNELLFASHSRKSEKEADKLGIELAAKAGYDPQAMTTALSRLSRSVEVAMDQKESRSYFSDHPYTPDRVKSINKQIKKMSWTQKAPVSDNYIMEFNGALFGQSSSKGVIKGSSFFHPDLDFCLDFPETWVIDNQNQYIVAVNEEQTAGVYLTLDDPKLNPKDAAQAFVTQLGEEYQNKIVDAAYQRFNGREGYLVSFRDKAENQDVYAYALWYPFEDKLFQIMGIATKKELALLENTVLSLRTLTKEEQAHITEGHLTIVKAEKGETIHSLGRRVNNTLDEDLTCVINDKQSRDVLKEGEQIKVIKKYPYKH